MTKKIIMCPPDKFAVRYEINPWMKGNIETVDSFKAHQQWNECRNALIHAGADVIVMPTPPDDCPDAVFAANAGLIYDDMAIISQFHHIERQAEEPFFEQYFKEHGYATNCLPNYESDPHTPHPRIDFEGAGDALFSHDRKKLFLGYGFRTHSDAKYAMDWIFESEDVMVVPLRLIDPRWYHLDTAFCPLDTGEVLWYPGAFDSYSQSIVEAWFPNRMIEVSEDDALRFACNAVSIGNTIVMPKQSDDLLFNLTNRGYRVLTIDMSQFLRSGGACKCLTLEVVE